MSISWYSNTLLLVSFVLYMYLKLLLYCKWLDPFHSRLQTLAYCSWLYAFPYDPALSAGGSDESQINTKGFSSLASVDIQLKFFVPKFFAFSLKPSDLPPYCMSVTFVSVYFLVLTPYQYPLNWYIWPPQRQSLPFHSNGMFPGPGQSRSRRSQSYLLFPLL